MRDSELLRGIPRIRRARGFRLYDMQGRRYLDLFRDGALLGHRSAGSLTAMKSALSQGLAAALPSVWEQRLVAALARAFPRHAVVRLYASGEAARTAARQALGGEQPMAIHDPACGAPLIPGTQAGFWRPFLPHVEGLRVLLPVLPVTVGGAPAAACFAGGAHDVPVSDTLPAFILAAALRGFASLPAMDSGQCPLSTPAVDKALDSAPGWARTGPYVRAVFPESEYRRVHAEFLRAGVLLYPGYPGPSVLPGECSPGETKLLVDLFSGIPGG
jgi:hypothetical protein